jgi:NADH-quinone oxidoreductase subunit M
MAFRAPVLASVFLIFTLANLAMPGSANFAGEFLILLGLFKAKLAMALIASLGVVGAAAYALRLFIGAMHNRVGPGVKIAEDLSLRDGIVLVPILLVILVLAFYPQFGLSRSETSARSAIAGARAQQAQHVATTAQVVRYP